VAEELDKRLNGTVALGGDGEHYGVGIYGLDREVVDEDGAVVTV
jgi:hypothetical protein